MKLRFGYVLSVSISGAVLLMSAPWVGAPVASATNCPGGTTLDPKTGICWSQNSPSNSLGGSGNIPCLPGRIGLCMGALQNTPAPGAALKPVHPGGPAPRSWPK